MESTFKYEVSWNDANELRNELIDRAIPHAIQAKENGNVVFILPDLPHRVYNRVRKIFKGYGLKNKIGDTHER